MIKWKYIFLNEKSKLRFIAKFHSIFEWKNIQDTHNNTDKKQKKYRKNIEKTLIINTNFTQENTKNIPAKSIEITQLAY